MNDAETMNQSSYRRAFRYLKTSVSQSSLTSRLSGLAINRDVDIEALGTASASALQLVFFPSYARRVAKPNDEILVNVHGWISTPPAADRPSRRNRYTMMLARSLAGLPALPVPSSIYPSTLPDTEDALKSSRPTTASTISSKASSTSTNPHTSISTLEDTDLSDFHEDHLTPNTGISDGLRSVSRSSSMKRQGSSESQKFTRHYSDHDLVTCHANLTSRISPFLAKPVTDRWISCDILSDGKHITNMRMVTGENGHFRGTIKIPRERLEISELNILEAQIKDEGLSGSTEIHYVSDSGISVVSDMDDTVKHTNILAGMREAFRNAFVRDLPTLQIEGVRPWYESMKAMGCNIHYVSNAPYQLWPCLASFIRIAGLPSGSIHLKQYSGFLQGMFEPAAEKKRANVEKILMDFPDRKFLLIGDSGEQDLELYTELARSEYTHQILGIFIRDVSTIASALTTPTGETGEEFFSKNQGDDEIDTGHGSQALDAVKEVSSPPQLPKRRADSLIDLTPLTTTSQDVKSSKSQASNWADLLSLDARPTGHSIEPSADHIADKTKPASSRPVLPRKPTNLRFRTKDSEETRTLASEQQPKDTPRPLVSRSNSSSSIKVSTPTNRRPGILRTLSANSSTYYGEGRRMTKAQERTHAWEVRLARARASLPKRIKLYTWKEGSDCQEHAERLIRAAMGK